jgi:hypothetical protein
VLLVRGGALPAFRSPARDEEDRSARYEDGIVSVTTTDFTDDLVLDWFEEHGQELLEVNARGERWSAVAPPVPVE